MVQLMPPFCAYFVSITQMVENLDKIKAENLAGCPDYLEENKLCIDEWVNKLGKNEGYGTLVENREN